MRNMNKKNVTEIIFLLDRSGSMSGLEADTIGGFNVFIQKQCQLEGETILTAVLFDNQYEVLWDGINAYSVQLTEKEYFVRGSTSLLDAVGKTILDVNHRLLKNSKSDSLRKVIFVITTDGMENASCEFSYKKIKNLIKQQKEKYDWEFIFLGANIDAAKEADSLGIEANNAYKFEASTTGVQNMYDTICEVVSEKRTRK
jgi:uncharacterized protein YegL